MKDLTLKEWKKSEIIAPRALKNFRCYNNPTRIYVQAYYTKIENTIMPIIMQRWIPKYNDFTPDEERTTYYLPADVVDNIINNL